MPNATNITVAGNGSVAVVINTNLTLPTVDVSNMTAGSRLVVSLTNGTSTSFGVVQGTLPYTVRDREFAVIVRGCQPQRMLCTAVDEAGRIVCHYQDACCTSFEDDFVLSNLYHSP